MLPGPYWLSQWVLNKWLHVICPLQYTVPVLLYCNHIFSALHSCQCLNMKPVLRCSGARLTIWLWSVRQMHTHAHMHTNTSSHAGTNALGGLMVITLIDPSSGIRVMGYHTKNPITMQIKVGWGDWWKARLAFSPTCLGGEKKKREIQLLAQTALIVSSPNRVLRKTEKGKASSAFLTSNSPIWRGSGNDFHATIHRQQRLCHLFKRFPSMLHRICAFDYHSTFEPFVRL